MVVEGEEEDVVVVVEEGVKEGGRVPLFSPPPLSPYHKTAGPVLLRILEDFFWYRPGNCAGGATAASS